MKGAVFLLPELQTWLQHEDKTSKSLQLKLKERRGLHFETFEALSNTIRIERLVMQLGMLETC